MDKSYYIIYSIISASCEKNCLWIFQEFVIFYVQRGINLTGIIVVSYIYHQAFRSGIDKKPDWTLGRKN